MLSFQMQSEMFQNITLHGACDVPGHRADQAPAAALEEVSAKVRRGDPKDDEEDYSLAVWSGVLPLALVPGSPVPDARLDPAIPVPAYVTGWDRHAARGQARR